MTRVVRPINELTQAALKAMLRYAPATGHFYWREGRRGVVKGMQAGCIVHTDCGDYIVIRPTGFPLVHAHRLAFLYMTGAWPVLTVDHRNRVGTDNRWKNLRQATQGENAVNSYTPGRTGYKGVWKTPHGWSAIITIPGERRKVLGVFSSAKAAALAWDAAARIHHGQFAAVNFPEITAVPPRRRIVRVGSTTGYRGVVKPKHTRLYAARFQKKHLGYYATPIEAARAYDQVARRLRGDRAILNFPEVS